MTDRELAALVLSGTPLIDVRAPIEFAAGRIPGAVNIPLLDDEQRATIGRTYKIQGADAAVALGHHLISGLEREKRLAAWVAFAEANSGCGLYCFRGGMRSQLVAAALAEIGLEPRLLSGGYKRWRNFALESLHRAANEARFLVVSGFTGSGKTDLLRALSESRAVCDLELAARHRGSSFGAWIAPQPSQADFEHAIAVDLLRCEQRHPEWPILIEDESRLIGRAVIPLTLFEKMQLAPMLVVEVPRAQRARYLIRTYLRENYGLEDGNRDPERIERLKLDLELRLNAIARRLGGLFLGQIAKAQAAAIEEQRRTGSHATHQEWVEQLLAAYYDPVYLRHLDGHRDRVVKRLEMSDAACADIDPTWVEIDPSRQ